METMITKTRGLIAAPFTPFNAAGELALESVPAYADWLVSEEVVGAFICGTTGEGPSLTVPERLEVAEAWVKTAPASLRVIVHVGHNSLPESKRMAAHAAQIGAGAVACMPPYFFKPSGVQQVVDWCEAVAAAAPNIPFYYYHIPSMSGVGLSMAEFLKEAGPRIPNLAGIKFTFEDLEDYGACLELEGGRYDVLFGRDEHFLSALRLGALGAVGSTYNFAAPIYLKLMAAFADLKEEEARALQAQAVTLIDHCVQGPWHPIAAFKWLFWRVSGVDCGPVRAPVPLFQRSDAERLEKELKPLLEADLLHVRQSTLVS
jgi:N-acetylneuraminate lyase